LPFQIMATSMLWRTSYKAAAIVARSAGDVVAIAVWQVAYAVAVIGGAVISVRWGIAGVACSTAIAVFFHFTNLTRLALRRVPTVTAGAVLRAHVEGVVLAALALAGAVPVAWSMRATELGAAPTATAAIVAGVALPAAYAVWRIKRRATDWTWLVDRLRQMVKPKNKKKGKQPDPATAA
jgi:hypothetical protein